MSDHEYSQGVCQDGAAILKDGAPMTIEEILEDLRSGQSASKQVSCEGLIHLTREHWQALSLLEYAVRQGRGHASISKALQRLSEIHNLAGGDAGTDTYDGTNLSVSVQSKLNRMGATVHGVLAKSEDGAWVAVSDMGQVIWTDDAEVQEFERAARESEGREAVAWMGTHADRITGFFESEQGARQQFGFEGCRVRPLYTHPPKQQSGVPDGWHVHRYSDRISLAHDSKKFPHRSFLFGGNDSQAMIAAFLSDLITTAPQPATTPQPEGQQWSVPEYKLPEGYSVRFDEATGWHWYDDVHDVPADEHFETKAHACIGAWQHHSHANAFDVEAFADSLQRNCEPYLAEKIHYATDESANTRSWRLELFSVPTNAHNPEPFKDAMIAYLMRFNTTPQPTTPQPDKWVPEMTDELRWILGRPNFVCARLAQTLRNMGHEIKPKAEDEQAAVIHWMLTLHEKHGDQWKAEAESVLKSAKSERAGAES